MKKNCSTSFTIERDNENIEDVYVKIRFCVNRPRNEVYEFCRKVRHLPLFLTPLISVTEESDIHSFWKMKILGTGKIVGWDMEIVKEIKNQMISWSSAKKSALMTEGNVLFLDAPENNTTELRLFFSCKFLFNDLKDRSSILMKPAFKKLIKRDIKKFKKVMEIYNGEGGEPKVWI